jgi:ABC-type sugar transport system substrate-binding protein
MERIGLFLNSTGDYHRRIVNEAQEAGREAGVTVDVFDAQDTAAKLAQDVVRFSHDNARQKACAVVVPRHDSNSAGPIDTDPTVRLARRVLANGVGWITINHGREDVIAPLRAEFAKLPIAIVPVDNVEFGRVQGRQLRSILPQGGNVLCVQGDPSDSASRDRLAGLREEILRTKIFLEDIDGQWETHVAEPAVHKWVTSPLRAKKTLHAIVCQNDHMGVGARKGLARAADELGRPELKTLPVLGGDGLPEYGKRWVDEGKLTSTVSVALPGRPVIQQLVRYWREGYPLPPITRLPVTSYPAFAKLPAVSAR